MGNGVLPTFDGGIGHAMGIPKVAQVITRAAVLRGLCQGMLQDHDVLEPMREAPVHATRLGCLERTAGSIDLAILIQHHCPEVLIERRILRPCCQYCQRTRCITGVGVLERQRLGQMGVPDQCTGYGRGAGDGPLLPGGAGVHWVEGKRCVDGGQSSGDIADAALQGYLEVARLVVTGVAAQGTLCQAQCVAEVAAARLDACKFVECSVLPGGVPGCLVERIEGLVVARLEAQRKTQIVVRFAVVRVRVAAGDAHNRASERMLSRLEIPPTERQKPHRVVAPTIVRITPQCLEVVILGLEGRMPILLEVQSVEEQFVGRAYLGRWFSRRRSRWDILECRLGRRVAHQLLAGGTIRHDQHELVCGERLALRDVFDQHPHRVECRLALPQQCAVALQGHGHATRTGHIDPDVRLLVAVAQMHHHVGVGVAGRTDALVRHKVLLEALFFTGHQPRKIRLVVGERSTHELNVRAVFVGQLPIPH